MVVLFLFIETAFAQDIVSVNTGSLSAVSLAPALVAIALAMITKSVLPSLFFGVWCGAWLLLDGNNPLDIGESFLNVFTKHLLDALYDRDHLSVICFTLMLGGMVGILSKNGGMYGMVNLVIRFANTAKRGQVTVTSLGFMIFFDDVANTLLIGKTMRPVTDQLKISREKLAFLVDSTAAPLASIALATTWVGYEVSLIENMSSVLEGFTENSYSVFLSSILYSFYPILMLVFVWTIALSGRDFGPMLIAENKARNAPKRQFAVNIEADAGDLGSHSGSRPSALNAILPIVSVILSLAFALVMLGEGETFQARIGSANNFEALMIASFTGAACAALMTLLRKSLDLEATVQAWFSGVQATSFAMIVIIFAWAISDQMQELNAAGYLVSLFSDSFPAFLLPAIIFLLSAIISFSTGTSWGAMGIMIPLALPIAWASVQTSPEQSFMLYAVVAAVLSGATFGDHCSPISDTTILSSLSSSCDHIEHVRTQAPYALVVASIAIFVCALPIGLGGALWLFLPLGILVTIFCVRILGHSQ